MENKSTDEWAMLTKSSEESELISSSALLNANRRDVAGVVSAEICDVRTCYISTKNYGKTDHSKLIQARYNEKENDHQIKGVKG